MTQVTALVLRTVAAGHAFGFDVMERCGLPSGTVYPALRRLERAGWLAAQWEDADVARTEGRPRRKTYALTARGRHGMPAAEAKLAEVERLLRDAPTPDARSA
jgi:DNA-binding PadR family transcriptional regulator